MVVAMAETKNTLRSVPERVAYRVEQPQVTGDWGVDRLLRDTTRYTNLGRHNLPVHQWRRDSG